MIVADLLKKNLFPDFQIIAGSAGMSREITAVTVLEAPDADRWMRGGEFMVGSGFVFKDDPEQLTGLLRRMNDKGVAATGFKLDRFHHRLPESSFLRSKLSSQKALRSSGRSFMRSWTSTVWISSMTSVHR